MKRVIVTSIVLLAGVAGQAAADCTNNRVTVNLQTFFAGNTVCGERGSGPNLERWQEEHHGTGNGASQLWDYKEGDGHPVDPRKQVGTWSATQSADPVVTYSYTGGTSYTYSIYDAGSGRYSFCSGGTESVNARIQTGLNAACTSF